MCSKKNRTCVHDKNKTTIILISYSHKLTTMKRLCRKLLLLAALVGGVFSAQAQQQVAVFTLNDFHAAFVRNDDKGIVGAPSILQTLDSLKQVYPCNVTVSAGDNFGGSYFYNATHGVLLPDFFNEMGIRISGIGNHEFDDGQRSLADKWTSVPSRPADWDITYVCANVRSEQTGAIPPFASPVVSVPVELPDGRTFRIAFLGLLTSSTPQQASVRKLQGLTFDGKYNAVIDSVLQLPEGSLVPDANLRILLTHIGSGMGADGKPKWNDKDEANLYAINSPLWHGIISSHSHLPVCGTIGERQYPIEQGRWHGDFIGMLLCTIDSATMQVTKVEPRLVRVSAKNKLEPRAARLQAKIDSLLQHTCTAGGTPIGTKLATVSHPMRHDREDNQIQTEMGTLVCQSYAEAYRKAAGLDDAAPIVGCSHFGSIRAGFSTGEVSVLDVGEVLPFSNAIRVFRLSGKQLTALVEFGLHNDRFGRIQTGNLEIEQDAATHVKRLTYVSPKGKRTVVKAKGQYFVAADDFMTHGGDGYSPSLFPDNQEVKAEGMPFTTDAFVNYLRGGSF